ncbi:MULTISPECIES: hypothetical protein [unclassified Streptomyces]|uniref:hypothetical protein n=1 Tax=unclassified Streptomyces TaxID=2593676 RepID=UPI001BE7FF99|nr:MULTISPECIES: hypothetical protein [unclassified Streptomyces]MBT2408722.1 hypothetical protein [Streptomyces sp. ISL-21]MBT2613723.1 hypothetical protein [Streptomyces sp. ISL-87]
MIESVPSLAVTLAQIRALAKERQLDVDEMLDVEDLAAGTGVPSEVTAALLRGEELEEPTRQEADELARRRAEFLCTTSLDASGRPYPIADIAAAIDVTPWWVAELVAGGTPPGMERHGPRIAAFFGQESTFLTDTPSQAVSRALQPVVRSLDNTSGDLMANLVRQYGLVSMSTRGKTLTHTQETLLLGMITGMLSSEGAV